jgi:hypothetical protein
MARIDEMPLRQALATTRRRRMLGREDGMPAPWRLSSVVTRLSRRQAVQNESSRVVLQDFPRLPLQQTPIFGGQLDTPSEATALQGGEKLVSVTHFR